MTKKRKIIIGVIVSIVVLFFGLGILSYFGMYAAPPKGRPEPMPEGRPAGRPEPMPEGSPEPTPLSSVDRLLDKMEFGAIAFNAPSKMNINDSPQIQLLLSLAETVDKLKQSIVEEGEKVGAAIRVSNRMQARVTGYMFQITAITPEIQAVSKHQKTEWKWEINPKKEGSHTLHLTLTALLEIDGYSTPRAIRTFDKKIEITVTKTQKLTNFFMNNWQWLWAAILVPIAGWLWKRKKAANKANSADAKSSAAD